MEYLRRNMYKQEHNATTGEIQIIPLSAEELVDIEKMQIENEKIRLVDNATDISIAKAALLAKLGITAEEAKLLCNNN